MTQLYSLRCAIEKPCIDAKLPDCSIDLLDGRATCAAWCGSACASKSATWHTPLRHATAAAGRLVHFHHDGVHNAFELLLLGLEFVLLCQLVLVQPVKRILNSLLNFFLVVALKLLPELLLIEGVAHGETIILQTILGFNLLLIVLILRAELLRFLDHSVNLCLRQAALLIGDCDLIGLSSGLVLGRDVQYAICINVEGHLNLGNTTRSRWNAIQMELAQQIVVFGHCTLTLKHLNEHTWLIVGVGCEGLALLRGDGCVPLNELGHHPSGGLQPHGQRRDVEQE
mmetsp:Transcript_42979/g.124244  ORF Transcript_42979/g.124244 Transcript_42979/m.124244 type:complete len:284 (+) Transcript_42979:50-901(+)